MGDTVAEVNADQVIAALVAEYAAMTRRSSPRPYAQGFGSAIVVAGMDAWGVSEEEAAERIDEMITDYRESKWG